MTVAWPFLGIAATLAALAAVFTISRDTIRVVPRPPAPWSSPLATGAVPRADSAGGRAVPGVWR